MVQQPPRNYLIPNEPVEVGEVPVPPVYSTSDYPPLN